MHTHDTLERLNSEWPHPLSHQERKARQREAAIQNLERRLGVLIDRTDPMLGAMAALEMSLMSKR